MKYDLLDPFHTYLRERLPPNTASTYYAAIVKLFRDQQFHSLKEITPDFLEKVLTERFKTKNEFSAAKNSLLRLQELYPEIRIPHEEFFCAASSGKRNRSKRPKKNIYLDPVQRTVNQIKDKKLKYAYRLAMVSGLRVSELSALNASDLHFDQDSIQVSVKHGKGGSNGLVTCLPDPYLHRELQDYIGTLDNDGGTLFYPADYMRHEAHRLHLECHDFRRIFAIRLRSRLKDEGKSIEEINITVQEQLRHKRFSTTKRYLYNRKLYITKRKEAPLE